MAEENINHKFRLKKVDEVKHSLIEEINQNYLMSRKHKKVSRVLNYIYLLLIAISTITRWVSIFGFAFLIGIPIGITSSAIGLKICVITVAIQKYQSIIKKKRKKHDKLVLLAQSELHESLNF